MSLLLQALIFGTISAGLIAVAAVGFTLQYGVTNVLNLAYGTIITSAIFFSSLIQHWTHSLLVELIVGAAWGAAFSVAVSSVLLDRFVRRGANLVSVAIATISVALIIQYGLQSMAGQAVRTYAGSTGSGVRILTAVVGTTQLSLAGLAVAVMICVHLLLRHSRIGLAMRVMSADAALARTCGIRTGRVRAVTWLVSGALCGITGVCLGATVGAFDSTTGNDLFILVVAAAIVGGIGKPYGAMIGAVIIGVLSEATAAYLSPSLKDVVACLVIVLVLLFRPRGIFADYSSGRELVR